MPAAATAVAVAAVAVAAVVDCSEGETEASWTGSIPCSRNSIQPSHRKSYCYRTHGTCGLGAGCRGDGTDWSMLLVAKEEGRAERVEGVALQAGGCLEVAEAVVAAAARAAGVEMAADSKAVAVQTAGAQLEVSLAAGASEG